MTVEFVRSPEELASRIPSNCSIAVTSGDGPEVPMALARAIIRGGVGNLHLITVPTCSLPASGMMADLLIGAGCVTSVETSGISFGELGPAPRFIGAVRSKRLHVQDATCPAIYAAIQAGAKGQPFAALRGLLGSDLLRHRGADWKVVPNPFDSGDPVVVLKAINPDFGVFHAPYADRNGNVWIGRGRCNLDLAHASKRVLVTVDRIVEGDLFADEKEAAGVVPAFYVEAIAESPGGSFPVRLDSTTDIAAVMDYLNAARTPEGFQAYLDEHVFGRQHSSAMHR